jgi:putative endonuclease
VTRRAQIPSIAYVVAFASTDRDFLTAGYKSRLVAQSIVLGLDSQRPEAKDRGMEAKTSKDPRNAIGIAGELAVRQQVIAWNWHLIDHNVRWREGELDLIALDRRTLVFAEVKTLVARSPNGQANFSPFESITRRKQNQVRMLAKRWISDDLRKLRGDKDLRIDSIRFDAFAVTIMRDGTIKKIEHLEDAF